MPHCLFATPWCRHGGILTGSTAPVSMEWGLKCHEACLVACLSHYTTGYLCKRRCKILLSVGAMTWAGAPACYSVHAAGGGRGMGSKISANDPSPHPMASPQFCPCWGVRLSKGRVDSHPAHNLTSAIAIAPSHYILQMSSFALSRKASQAPVQKVTNRIAPLLPREKSATPSGCI